MNQIGINTFLFTSPFTNESIQWFPKFKKWGFDTVEIAADDPAALDAVLIKEALAENDLVCQTVCGVMGPDRDLRGDAQQQAASLGYIKATVDFIQEIGATMLVGPLYSTVGRADLVSPQAYKQQQHLVVRHLKSLTDYAGDKSIKLAVEPLNRFETDFLNTSDQALELCTLVNSSNLYIHLDTFHMNIEEKDLPDAMRRVGKRLGVLHACGCDRGTPGKDHTDWNGIKLALRDIDYKGQLVIESFTPEVKVMAKAASIWRNIESSGEEIAVEGAKFLKRLMK